MNNGKIIAVWGSSNSGKTTTAAKLGMRLASMKKDVLIVLTDITAPDMNVLLPFEKDNCSMGDIWSSPDCNTESIYNSCMVTSIVSESMNWSIFISISKTVLFNYNLSVVFRVDFY